ncbi:serine/threonine protein kinase [Oryzobacter sp. R7]|uniref:serine/threonine protein kinase n=1 Tax=Oryzobacter faecalis TaxID=3388656 RepID=UPI00398D5D18
MGEGEHGHRARHGHGHAGGAAGGSVGDPARPDVPGLELGELVARGATSEVWAGVEVGSGRRVAVKVVGADLGALDAAAREASLSARASSAHVVAVDACVPLPDGRVALVMPHVGGGPLDALVRARGHLAAGEVVTVLAPLASALGRLHDLGVVHGDVSPGNVLLELDGRPVLADLGLGHVVGEVTPGVWGTDGYVAPEVLMGADPGPAADVYALGALGWLCLSGQVPGPPGLRPTLAELSLAGEGSGAVVTALEAAVSPQVADRPTAHELAWQLFHAARPEPLHLVHGEDETSAVTYRLRAAAAHPPEVDERMAWSDRFVRRWVGAASVRLTRGRHARPAPPTIRRRALVTAAAVLLLLVAGGAVAGTAGWRLDGAARADAPSARPEVVRPAGPAPAGDVRLDPTAPRDRPAELVAVLAEARALAWREASPAHLHGADAPGSAAEARDRAAVTELSRSGLRYVGLRYTVRDAVTLTAADATARVRARIDTGAYGVVGTTASTPRPASAGEEVVLTLVLTDVGWRVSDVVPAP